MARYKYDAFISHAVEDKIIFANDLNRALAEKGLELWYSGKELSVGVSIVNSIQDGLNQSRFGIVVISRTYLTKIWALAELTHFLQRTDPGKKVILPVLLDVKPEELAAILPGVFDRFAVRAEKGVEFVAQTLFNQIANTRKDEKRRSRVRQILLSIVIVVVGALAAWFLSGVVGDSSRNEIMKAAVVQRTEILQQDASRDLQHNKLANDSRLISLYEARQLYSQYENEQSRYRNEYELQTGHVVIRHKKNVEAATGWDIDKLSPRNSFGIDSVIVYLREYDDIDGRKVKRLTFVNVTPIGYRVESGANGADHMMTRVSYQNPLRIVDLELTFPRSSLDIKRYEARLTALLPTETFSFVRKGGTWELESVR